jgi:3',5'-cyclic AMP phosphodiesterase CpdA
MACWLVEVSGWFTSLICTCGVRKARSRARLEAASRWRVLGATWLENLAQIRSDGTAVDLVVFTGDLSDWGHTTDYPRALAFLTQTCAALDVPLDRLFVVPGNHDIDRTVQRMAWE